MNSRTFILLKVKIKGPVGVSVLKSQSKNLVRLSDLFEKILKHRCIIENHENVFFIVKVYAVSIHCKFYIT